MNAEGVEGFRGLRGRRCVGDPCNCGVALCPRAIPHICADCFKSKYNCAIKCVGFFHRGQICVDCGEPTNDRGFAPHMFSR